MAEQNASNYLTMECSKYSLCRINAFALKQLIDEVCGGEVDMCQKTKEGMLLIKTKNSEQYEKLLKLQQLDKYLPVMVKVCCSTYETKGIIYTYELSTIPRFKIMELLKSQHVGKVDRMCKFVNGKCVPTGLVVVSFNLPQLPEKLYLGYEMIQVRPYIPKAVRASLPIRESTNSKTETNYKATSHTTNAVNICSASFGASVLRLLNMDKPNVDGQKYMGQGRSKKVARIEAAATALRSFIQFKDGAVLSPLKPSGNLDFTSDEHLENGIENMSHAELVQLVQTLVILEKMSELTSLNQSTLHPQMFCMSQNVNKSAIAVDGQKKVPDKGPVMLLYELFNDVNFECMNIDGAQNNCRFKMTVTINEKKFDGTGPSKKLAKNAAAKAALASLCNISYSPMMAPQKNVPLPIDDKSSSMELPQIHADTIGRLVLEKFMEVIKGQEAYSRRKVLAGIVMTENMNFNEAKVISVSTGTKCVSGEHMSVNGAVLNDSHAEIVSRRCLLKYLYAQLDLQCSQATAYQSIFVRNTDGQYPYKLKSGVHFHLYINTAPCGDARIFSPHENDTGVDKHPNRKARGQLRTKIESGEGTIPVKSSEGIQTWDGVLTGQRLLTMSCSDKIARWNIVGIQGSLLSSIIEPVYLHSIVLGNLLHPEHMYRAVCGRIEKSIQGLPPPYHLNKPRLAQVTSAETRNQAKSPNFGINWTIGDTELEVINSLTGRTIGGSVSRITKHAFFVKYGFLMKNLPGLPNRKVTTDYGQTKARVKDYQTAKLELFSAFKREDLGSWLKKPIEQDEFYLPE